MRSIRGVRRVRGVSLVEACVTIGVLAILLGTAIPSFSQLRQRVAMEGTVRQLAVDLNYVRGEAVARAESLRVSFSGDASFSCYVVHTGGEDDCACTAEGAAQCLPGVQALKSVRLAASDGLRIQSNSQSMVFDGVRGTVSPSGSVNVIGAGGQVVQQRVSFLGRVRTCSPQRPPLQGYPAC